MAALLIEEEVEVRSAAARKSGGRASSVINSVADQTELRVELGIWLSGLESFLSSGHQSFAGAKSAAIMPNTSKEFSLVNSALQRCSRLAAEISADDTLNRGELAGLTTTLRETLLLGEVLTHSGTLGPAEWNAWSNLINQRLCSNKAVNKLVRDAEKSGETFLPEILKDLAQSCGFLTPEHAELALILPRFGKILKWLSVVGKMLENDEPLKPALLIFSRVNEQIFEMTNYISNRLERFPDEDAELFSSLDAAAYTASIELKKVYSQELAGVAQMRPSPSIYARMETAHSLLNDGFQQIVAGFARVLDPEADVFELFPNFKLKHQQSLVLQRELAAVVKIVRAAENAPEKRQIEALHKTLRPFLQDTVQFLFYKDTETVERFIEEILVTKENMDLVPILHRFGAYLETLSAQVSLRTVLADHPSESR